MILFYLLILHAVLVRFLAGCGLTTANFKESNVLLINKRNQ